MIPLGSIPFLIFGEGGSIDISSATVSVGGIHYQPQWSESQGGNPLHFGWNTFQSIFISQSMARGNPNQHYGNFGSRNAPPQTP